MTSTVNTEVQVLCPGHKYYLPNFDNPVYATVIQFIEKEPIEEGSSELKVVNDGITNEQLLEVLADRIDFLNKKFPCRENSIALTHIETALLWLNKRTSDRKKRGVEGKLIK